MQANCQRSGGQSPEFARSQWSLLPALWVWSCSLAAKLWKVRCSRLRVYLGIKWLFWLNDKFMLMVQLYRGFSFEIVATWPWWVAEPREVSSKEACWLRGTAFGACEIPSPRRAVFFFFEKIWIDYRIDRYVPGPGLLFAEDGRLRGQWKKSLFISRLITVKCDWWYMFVLVSWNSIRTLDQKCKIDLLFWWCQEFCQRIWKMTGFHLGARGCASPIFTCMILPCIRWVPFSTGSLNWKVTRKCWGIKFLNQPVPALMFSYLYSHRFITRNCDILGILMLVFYSYENNKDESNRINKTVQTSNVESRLTTKEAVVLLEPSLISVSYLKGIGWLFSVWNIGHRSIYKYLWENMKI